MFFVWIGAAHFGGQPAHMPAALAASPIWLRYAWIAIRVLGAVLTVPIAEELAFRGYLLRRFTRRDFESVPFASVTAIAIAGSSVLFGLMHGGLWLLGSIAGVAYALLSRRSGRIGDAVVAHAVTNALLAGFVLVSGQWQYW